MADTHIPVLVFRSARPGASFEDWLHTRLNPPRRRALAAGIMAFLPHWGGTICAVRMGRKHGPALFQIRLRFHDPGPDALGAAVGLSAFFYTERDALVLLSGAVVTDMECGSETGTPGLGDARWRLRELMAADQGGGSALSRLVFDAVCSIKDQSGPTPWPSPTTGARSASQPALVDFRQTYREVQAEAEAEGPGAVAQLCRAEDRFRLASAVLLGRRRSGLTQRRLATVTRLPQGKISRIESGLANPTLATTGALARALGIALSIGWRAPP